MGSLFPESDSVAPAVLAVGAAVERLQGHRDIYHALLRTFVANERGDIKKLCAALDAGQLTEARRLAHSLRGAAAILGADQLSAKAAQIEQLLRSGAASDVITATLIPPLDEALVQALAAARRELNPLE